MLPILPLGLLNRNTFRIIVAAVLLLLVGALYYYWHVKPISDLTKKNDSQAIIIKDKTEIIHEAKTKVLEETIHNNTFENKWKNIKEKSQEAQGAQGEHTKENHENHEKNQNHQMDINTSLGKHSIIL